MFRDFHYIKLIWKESRFKIISASFNISDTSYLRRNKYFRSGIFSTTTAVIIRDPEKYKVCLLEDPHLPVALCSAYENIILS